MKLNYKRTILVGFAFFLICAFWQAYDNTVPLILTNQFGMSQTWSSRWTKVSLSSRLSISDAVSRRTPGTTSRSVRWINHSTSTCTRARFRAGSLRWSTRGATAPR